MVHKVKEPGQGLFERCEDCSAPFPPTRIEISSEPEAATVHG